MNRTKVGDKAPEFKVPGYHAVKGSFETYALSDYEGKYVMLFFYPGDFTYVCPTELVALAKLKGEFEKAGVSVFVISTDSKFSHKVWDETELAKATGEKYPFPMLSDPAGRIGSQYGIYNEEGAVDLRGVVLIDKKGIVQLLHVNAAPIGRNPQELLRSAQALKEHDDNGGKIVPACWIPGDLLLDPSFENTGKVMENCKNPR